MRLSIVIAILNSHEIVRRQILHFEKMAIPDGVEIVFVDDGSTPPITSDTKLKNFRILYTNDFRPWTVELARNFGIKNSQGEYVLITDIDYIIPLSCIESALDLKEDKSSIRREFGVLDENGNFTQDMAVLKQWGLQRDSVRMNPHPNNFIMRKSVFDKIGYFDESRVNRPYPIGADAEFKRRFTKYHDQGLVTLRDNELRPTIYMFPNGQYCGDVDYNPFNLFHTLTRKTEYNMELQKQREQGRR
jgi:glycosyltransferase involved in cell wall biosynthesis